MKNRSYTLKGFVIGLFVAMIFMATIGAVDHQSQNKVGETTTNFKSVYASSDGKIVYVIDNDKDYRSNDGGANWRVVLKKSDKAGF